MTPHLTMTMGDPAGIGPEIIVNAARRLRSRIDSGSLRLLIIGDNATLEPIEYAEQLATPSRQAIAA